MPTASEYRAASSRFRQLGENCLRQAAVVAGWRLGPAFGEGPVAGTVAGHLQTSSGCFAAAADELQRLARVCDARAMICADYARRLVAFWALPDEERRLLPVPVRPHPWVEA